MLFAERSGAAGGGQASLHREGGRWRWGGEGEGKRLREGEERREEKEEGEGNQFSTSPQAGGERRRSGAGRGEERHSAKPTRQEARDQGRRCPGQKPRQLRAAGGL